ncbi:unnamed protein product [Staurois parvus]|uniref:Uncharacterized protein n=1 Tax=Staurois parvus TaxID=386267 RepID=A0ABN9C5B8_9NEOB|nr:unnamed protein product [Staurois parvus]
MTSSMMGQKFLPLTQMIGSNDINDGAEFLPLTQMIGSNDINDDRGRIPPTDTNDRVQ